MTVIEEILSPFGYTSNDVSTFGFLYSIFGMFGGMAVSAILSKTRIFKQLTAAVIIGTILTFIAF